MSRRAVWLLWVAGSAAYLPFAVNTTAHDLIAQAYGAGWVLFLHWLGQRQESHRTWEKT